MDDSVGGDTNGDGTASSPAPGDWGGFSVEDDGSLTLHGSRIRYAGTALAISGGTSLFDGTIQNSQTVATVSNGELSIRGNLRNTGQYAVTACDWGTPGCAIDAANVNWGTGAAGPTPVNGNPRVCGAVTVAPWSPPGGTTSTFAVPNCDGAATPDQQLSQAAQGYSARIAQDQIQCDNGFQDFCQALQTAQNCLSAAQQLAVSQAPFPLTPQDQASAFGSQVVDKGSQYLQNSDSLIVSDIGHVTGFLGQVLGFVGLVASLSSAYGQCG